MSKFVETNEKIAEKVVEGYQKIETGVVTGYKKMEKGIVDGFEKVTDKCVEVLFAKEGETIPEAKARLSVEKRKINKTETFPKNFKNILPLGYVHKIPKGATEHE